MRSVSDIAVINFINYILQNDFRRTHSEFRNPHFQSGIP